MGVVYGTRQGVQAKARRSLSLPAREIASANATTDTLECEGHNLVLDDPVQFRAEVDGVLPAPLASATVYYAKPVNNSTSLFQVATTAGGAAVNLTSAGTLPFSLVVDVGSLIDAALEHYARWIDSLYTAHGAPFDAPYPKVIVNANEYFALASVVRQLRMAKDFADILDEVAEIKRDLLRMAERGIGLRDATATGPSQLAVSSASDPVTDRTDTIP